MVIYKLSVLYKEGFKSNVIPNRCNIKNYLGYNQICPQKIKVVLFDFDLEKKKSTDGCFSLNQLIFNYLE